MCTSVDTCLRILTDCALCVKKLIEEADTDGSGEIEYDEFKQMFDS